MYAAVEACWVAGLRLLVAVGHGLLHLALAVPLVVAVAIMV